MNPGDYFSRPDQVSSPSGIPASDSKTQDNYSTISPPAIDLPRGGGSIRAIGEKFSVNAVNGSAGCSIPLPFSPSRNGFMPSMELGYNSGTGNSVFGLGWQAGSASITRKTEKQLPLYRDGEDSDVFIFSGAEDLVPFYKQDAFGNWTKDTTVSNGMTTVRYRPRIEGSFSRIEKITEANGNIYWKTTTGSNVISVFGKSSSARVSDPADPTRTLSWLLEFSCDDKGNCWQIGYKPEDLTGVPDHLHEQNRLRGLTGCTNTYVKRVRYGNKHHFNRMTINWDDWDNFLNGIDYLLEGVLDYGEHDLKNPRPVEDKAWTARQDPFSIYRGGFEIRTWRLCRRVLMFHRFPELGTKPCLVRSMELVYDEGPAFTFLKSVTQKGFIREKDGTYSEKSLPPVEFQYASMNWDTELHSLTEGSLENLPMGIDGQAYQWVDLYNEGISGILTEQVGSWFYKSNAGNGNFDSAKLVATKPSLQGISSGALHFQDVGAGGQQFLVRHDREGYYELGDDQHWQPFKSFNNQPRIDWQDPNLKMLDLNGDGMADVLITEEEVFTWYAAKGREGYESYQTVRKELDEEKGPNLVFADSSHAIVLADMSGDGLMDIVRIRNSEVCYWPNLGYGCFGAKVSMSNAPVLDNAENFNPRHVKLADLDGSGTTDIIYLGQDFFQIYFNQAGNSWSEMNVVNGLNPLPFPKTDDYSTVMVIDLLGAGTFCIVWSSPLAGGPPLRYIDLTGGIKPHILIGYKNNMGKEAQWQYKPSSFFYLQDKKAGTPWVTRLPFVVHCVSQVVMSDQIQKTRFTSQYTYHHGYYDHAEQEFRGFGRVDQTDTEDFQNYQKNANPDGSIQIVDEGFHEPPVLTKTWFHTGAFLDREKVLNQFAHEYYSNAVVPELELADPPLPAVLSINEWREALRACKGIALRMEVYSKDGSLQQNIPYTTSQHSCLVKLLQPALENKYAVFLVQAGESLTYTYERNPADPRIAHSMTLAVDDFGNVLQSAAITYGRKAADASLSESEKAEQGRTHIVISVNNFSNTINTPDDYRLPVPWEEVSFELTGASPAMGGYFGIDEISNFFNQASIIDYQVTPTTGQLQKRLIGHSKSVFLKNDLSGPLEPGVIGSLGLPFQTYKLCLTPGLRDLIFGDKVNDDLLLAEGKYVHFGDDNYWIVSGEQSFDPDNFYQVIALTDPFGFTSQIQFDPVYRWYVQQTTDALQNTYSVAGFNFRTLSPYLVKDLNDNRSGVRTDEIGMVISSFIMGKEGESVGDKLDATTIEASVNDQPSVVMEYDLLNYLNNGLPNLAKTISNELHYFDNPSGAQPIVRSTGYVYFDGNGQPILKKLQAEPGIALRENADGTVTQVDTTPNPRWIGNGRTILNNKGKPVKKYEPYFSTSFEFEDARELVERGVTSVIQYDSAGRAIRTDEPDGTFTKVVFDAWTQLSFDRNDTVLDSQWYRDRITKPVATIATPEEIDAAEKAAAHANTPGTVFLDSMGRSFLSLADNGSYGKYRTSTVTDIHGNQLSVTDAAGNPVMEFIYDMLGSPLYHRSMDAGERWIVRDTMGRLMRSWDNRGHRFRYEYDRLHRPLRIFMQQGTAVEINTEKIMYGEGLADAKTHNLCGHSYQHYDAAGVVTNMTIDFKGNEVEGNRQLLKNYKDNADWNILTATDLEEEIFSSHILYDAFNRAIRLTTHDNSVIRPVYSESGPLQSVFVSLKGAEERPFVKDIRYDAKGQRETIVYGNDIKTSYEYDPKTSRLLCLITSTRNQGSNLQNLQHVYDPSGNISFLKDVAQPDIFFDGSQVKAENDYVYDAVYRLIKASGREHAGQNNVNDTSTNNNFPNFPFENAPNANDAKAFRNYTQKYVYDATGNILQLQHVAGTGSYTRTNQYNNNDKDREALGIDDSIPKNNRLLASAVGAGNTAYTYDEHGNLLNQPQLKALTWNFKDELQIAGLGGGGTAYYVYDGDGKRIRKVIERKDGSREERIYLGGYELYRKWDSAGKIEDETETLHILDNSRRIASAETRTIEGGVTVTDGNWKPLIRYQFTNSQGSSALELDENAATISYEEYHPYGTSSFTSAEKTINAAFKRYRYLSLERDEESGLEYHGARYYLPWLGRWLSTDPTGIGGGINLYEYAKGNPVIFKDTGGNSPILIEGLPLWRLNDRMSTGTYTEDEINDDTHLRTLTFTDHGYGWFDMGNGKEVKLYYNLTSKTITDRKTGKILESFIKTSFFSVETETRLKNSPITGYTKVTPVDAKKHFHTSAKTKSASEHPVFNRVIGGLKLVGAYVEMTAGAALTATGIGAIIGVPLIAHGADVAISGARSLVDGEYHRTFTSEYILQKGLGMSERSAEITDMIISFVGGIAKAGQAGLKALARSASKQPFTTATIPDALGVTSPLGDITLDAGLSGAEKAATLTHEGVHRLLTPLGSGAFNSFRRSIGNWSYFKVDLFRWLEEGLAESAGQGSWVKGFRWINKVGPIPKPYGYGINFGKALIQGEILIFGEAGTIYGGYKLSHFLLGDKNK